MPIGVDIDNFDQPNNQYTAADSAWVNDAIDRFNVLVRPVYGVDQYVWMPGNGAPNRQTGKTGILWQVDDNGSNSTDRFLNLDNAHMLGATISIQPQALWDPTGATREKELFYRANNGTTSQWPIGIFKVNPQPRVPFNDRHLVLHAQLNKASQTGKNDLSAWDYIRPLELPPPER